MTVPRQLADALIVAERERKPIAAFTDAYPFLDVGRAYEAQRLFVGDRVDGGEQVIGAKLGMTSGVKRAMLGVDQPVSGWLTVGMVMSYGQPVPLDQLIHPQAEPEIAVLLGEEPAWPATVVSVLSAIEAVFAAIEVIDSRFKDFRYRLPDVIADNVGAARLVLGSRACTVSEAEICGLSAAFSARAGRWSAPAGAAVMGHPAAAVAWLVNTLAARGERLRAGSIVLTGGLTAPVALGRGGAVTAEFDGLGSVEVYG